MALGRSEMLHRSPVVRYGVATLLVCVATALTSLLWLVVDRPVSTPIFLGVIVLVTWTGGLRLGIYATALTTLIFDYYFISPYRDIGGGLDVPVRMTVFFL